MQMTSQLPIVEWLSRGGPCGQAPEIVETHAAIVFLTGDRAYKMKKAVNLGYLDFRRLEGRHAVLERELVLNRRTAASLYLRVVPVTRLGDSDFMLGGDGSVAEWLLEMRRFPSDALLSGMAERGMLDEALIERLAVHIAEFHDRADSVIAYDWPAAVARIGRENADDLKAQTKLFDAEDVKAVTGMCEALLTRALPALQRQSADVRRCHGDLHLGNIFLD